MLNWNKRQCFLITTLFSFRWVWCLRSSCVSLALKQCLTEPLQSSVCKQVLPHCSPQTLTSDLSPDPRNPTGSPEPNLYWDCQGPSDGKDWLILFRMMTVGFKGLSRPLISLDRIENESVKDRHTVGAIVLFQGPELIFSICNVLSAGLWTPGCRRCKDSVILTPKLFFV